MLAKRLARHGVSPSGVAGLAPAGVPGIVVSSTIQAAAYSAATSAPVAALIQGVLNAMFVTKLKTAAVVLAMLGAATLACGMLAGKGDGPEKAAAKGEAEKSAKKATPDPKADALRRERKKFEGTWRCVSMEVNGKKLADGTFGWHHRLRRRGPVEGPDGATARPSTRGPARSTSSPSPGRSTPR